MFFKELCGVNLFGMYVMLAPETIYADNFNAVGAFDARFCMAWRRVNSSSKNWDGRAKRYSTLPGSLSSYTARAPLVPCSSFSGLCSTLSLHEAIRKLAINANWRLRQVLRTRKFHPRFDLPRFYTAQIPNFLEAGTHTTAHAAPSLLDSPPTTQKHCFKNMTEAWQTKMLGWRDHNAPRGGGRTII